MRIASRVFFFFFTDTATTEIYTLSLHDALPIYPGNMRRVADPVEATELPVYLLDLLAECVSTVYGHPMPGEPEDLRSEEHTSELQSQSNLVCRLLLGK